MRTLALLCVVGTSACATSGSAWMREANVYATSADPGDESELPRVPPARKAAPTRTTTMQSRTLGQPEQDDTQSGGGASDGSAPVRVEATGKGRAARPAKFTGPIEGKKLGTFRNTYYDFPSESDFMGEKVTLHNAQCKAIAQVPRGFYEAVCVQGSGLLSSGNPVSFNRRDCECAEICPRTQQKICFDSLDIAKFPWGRGASGGPITPLLTVAVDTNVVPLGTPIYIPEFDGLPRDLARQSLHDGCFIAQDRGLRVQGQHVDVFTGQRTMTEMWNGLVPSNTGVTVVIDSPKCARASD